MAFTFVHSADWQIGKPFRNLPPATAGRLEGARLDVIDRLAEVARAAGATDVVVAGDIYDSESLPAKILRQPLERMARQAGIMWHLLPGNHDPARPGGVWARVQALGLPGNVRAIVEPAVYEVAPNVMLLPAPLRARSQSGDPTAYFDSVATPPGALRVALAHGSIQDFGEEGDSAARIDPARARKAGLAYLALGDWHGAQRIDERTWYSGTPEPDRFRANDPGFALVVRLDGTALPVVERVATARYAWLGVSERVAHLDDLGRIERAIVATGVAPGCVLLDLVLSGSLPLAARAGLDRWREVQEGRLEYVRVDTTGIAVAADAADLSLFGAAGELRHAAEYLHAIAGDVADPRRLNAAAALVRLAEETTRVCEASS